MKASIERRPFGRSGHESTVTLFGAAALKASTQSEADKTLDVLLEYGINHIDVAARYGDAELRIGPWMKNHRRQFFLATKTGERSRKAAAQQIRRSLERLQVDHVDLIQLHSMAHPDEWDEAMSEDGALQAAIDARDEGLVKSIGITGHGWTMPAMHMRALARFDFDSVLMPLNYLMWQNERYRSSFNAVRELCRSRNVAVQTIKSIARGPWATAPVNRNTWYQPLEEQSDIDAAVHWVLGHEGVFLNTVGDVQLLPKVLDAAARFEARPTDVTMDHLVANKTLSSLFGLGT